MQGTPERVPGFLEIEICIMYRRSIGLPGHAMLTPRTQQEPTRNVTRYHLCQRKCFHKSDEIVMPDGMPENLAEYHLRIYG